VRPSEVVARALVVGDPGRAEQAAGLLDSARQTATNREYTTYTGSFGGREITIASHGVGAAGAGVCFEELARAGVRAVVRAGTCGAVDDEIGDGDLVVATAAVRDEGLTPRLVPLSYPAAADPNLSAALRSRAEAASRPVHSGIVLTSDLFYPSAALGQDWGIWKASRVLAVEMELAALYVVASLHGLAAGGVLTVDGNPTRAAQDMSEYDPYREVVREGTAAMLRVALEALAAFEPEGE
jgi:uridine phosphorylase